MPRPRRGGLGRELDVRDYLTGQGWEAWRTAKEIADVIAIPHFDKAIHPKFGQWRFDPTATAERLGHSRGGYQWCPLLVQVKSTAAGPYADFSPHARHLLIEAAARCGAAAWLVHWPPRNRPRWIPSEEWPLSKLARSGHSSVRVTRT